MRQDLRANKYKRIYDRVRDEYEASNKSIRTVCNNLGYSERYYYKICKELGEKSVAKLEPRPAKQKGGNGGKYNIAEQVDEPNRDNKQKREIDKIKERIRAGPEARAGM